MKKLLLVLLVLVISLATVTVVFARTAPPPPLKGRGCNMVEDLDAFNLLYPPPMGLTNFAVCWATKAAKEVCFEAPRGYGKNFTIRYWDYKHNNMWTTYNAPTYMKSGMYCVEPVPGYTAYALQGIAIGSWQNK